MTHRTLRTLATAITALTITAIAVVPLAARAGAQEEPLIIYPDGESTSILAECGDGVVDIFYQPSNGDSVSRSWAIFGPDGTDYGAPPLAVPGMRHTVPAVDGIRVDYILTSNGPLATYVVNAATCAPPPPTTSTTAPPTTTTVPPTTTTVPEATTTTIPETTTTTMATTTTTSTPEVTTSIITQRVDRSTTTVTLPETGPSTRTTGLAGMAALLIVLGALAMIVRANMRRRDPMDEVWRR